LQPNRPRTLEEFAFLAAVPAFLGSAGALAARAAPMVARGLATGAQAAGRAAMGLGRAAWGAGEAAAGAAGRVASGVSKVTSTPGFKAAREVKSRFDAERENERRQREQEKELRARQTVATRSARRAGKGTPEPMVSGSLRNPASADAALPSTSESIRRRMHSLLSEMDGGIGGLGAGVAPIPTPTSYVSGATTSRNVGAHYGVPFPGRKRGKTSPLLTRVFPSSAKKSRKHSKKARKH